MIPWGEQSDRVIQKGLMEEVMFELRPEGGRSRSRTVLGKGIPGKGNSKCKDPGQNPEMGPEKIMLVGLEAGG